MTEGGTRTTVAIVGTRGYPSYYGGFETAVRKLAPYLQDHDFDVTVYGRPGATLEDDPVRDIRVISRRTRGFETRSLSTLSYGLSACLAVARTKPDVVLVMNVANGYWLPLLKVRGLPTVVNVDGIEWDRDKWGKIAKRVFYTGARLTARFGTFLVYDAKEIQRRWGNEFGRDGHWIPYGGDVPSNQPVERGLIHRKYILAVARLVPENTIPAFLDSVEAIANRRDVVLVGSSGYGGAIETRVRQIASKYSRFHWFGHLNDDARLEGLWQHAGAYFHGHSVGGTNPALVQAMACGAPIVARDTPYNREVLGSCGEFVTSESSAIAHSLVALLDDEVRQECLAEAAQKRAGEIYSWEKVCANYLDLLLRATEAPTLNTGSNPRKSLGRRRRRGSNS